MLTTHSRSRDRDSETERDTTGKHFKRSAQMPPQCRISQKAQICYHVPMQARTETLCRRHRQSDGEIADFERLQNKSISGKFTHVWAQLLSQKQHHSTMTSTRWLCSLSGSYLTSQAAILWDAAERGGLRAQGRHLSSAPLSLWVIIKPFHNLNSLSVLNITSTTLHTKNKSTSYTAKS